jgi:adenine-specific DNA-methyltransferase
VFGGGFNVGINIAAKKVVYNDINCYVKQLVESFDVYDTYQYLLFVKKITKKFGLKPAYSEGYTKARKYYNSFLLDKRDPRLLFTVILYGFQQQIRFNGNHDFNNPVGMRWFNDKILEKMISFSRALKNKEIIFQNDDFTILPFLAKKKCMFYMDPPYRLTIGSYNDGKRGFNGWTIEHEKKLFQFADALNKNGSPFMISYILEHGGKKNVQFQLWIAENDYRVIEINAPPGRKRKEILVVNYGNT